MSANQLFFFVHQVRPENGSLTESRCLLCGVLVAGSAENKYLAIAEAAHKCVNDEKALSANA